MGLQAQVITAITWSAAEFIDLTTGTPAVLSDLFTKNADTISIDIQVKADNQSTPAADTDNVVFKVLTSPDDTVYDTAEHAWVPPSMNTNKEDPAIGNYRLPFLPKYLKMYPINQAVADTIRASVIITETLAPE